MDVMTAAYDDVPFSELLHHPAATAERLDAFRALRLRRRDAGDLALMRIEQLERDESVVEFTTRLLAGLVGRVRVVVVGVGAQHRNAGVSLASPSCGG